MHSKINLFLKIVLLIESIKVLKTVQLESNVFWRKVVVVSQLIGTMCMEGLCSNIMKLPGKVQNLLSCWILQAKCEIIMVIFSFKKNSIGINVGCFQFSWTVPNSILGSEWSSLAACLAQVIGNLSIDVSPPVLTSYHAIGRYWSKLDMPITNDQPIKSIFLIIIAVVFNILYLTYENVFGHCLIS